MARRKNQLVKVKRVEPVEAELVESLPLEASLPAGLPTTAAEMDRRMERKFAEMLARRDDGFMQPFFQSRRVYQELKRLQSVPEQRKWAVYFSRYGCLFCKSKKRPHSSCGMCHPCKLRVAQRLGAIVKELSKGGGK